MLPETQRETFFKFFDSTVENDVFDTKTTIIIQLASALTSGCFT